MARSMLVASFGPGDEMAAEELKQIDIFEDVDPKQLAKFPGTVRRRRFKAGDVICREGEGGTTAFYILEGEVEIFIGHRAERSGAKTGSGGLVAAIGRFFGQERVRAAPEHSASKLVPIDASVDLEYGRLATTLGPGEVFGEMSCLNLAPRSATVVAQVDTVCLEMLRNMYEILQRGKTFKERMERNYRSRALSGHLRNAPLCELMEPQDIDHLTEVVELVNTEPGQVLFSEGDDADAPETGGMYLIRLGQVKVSRKAPGGELTLAYLTKGDCFGETGLLRNTKRNATCRAVDHPIVEGGRKRRSGRVELVRITADEFERVIDKYPLIRGRLETLAEQRTLDQKQKSVGAVPLAPTRRVEELGLIQGQNLMLIDLERCTRCDQCVDACVASHEDGLTRVIREGPKYGKYLVPSACRMCLDPVCMIGCPVGSIRRTQDLNIFIEDWCIGCGLCEQQCPYDSIQMHDLGEFGEEVSEEFARVAEGGEVVAVTERAVVCDQCSSLPAGPACVYACPHDAALRVDANRVLSTGTSIRQKGT